MHVFGLFTSNMLSVHNMQFVSLCLWTECLDSNVFLHCLHSVLHHGPMEVIFQEFVHRDLVMRYILLLQLFEKAFISHPFEVVG